jgi:hypothetical protein
VVVIPKELADKKEELERHIQEWIDQGVKDLKRRISSWIERQLQDWITKCLTTPAVSVPLVFVLWIRKKGCYRIRM